MGFDVSFFQLLFKMLAGETGKLSKVDFFPQKPQFGGVPIEQPFERATPESQGVSSEYIGKFLKALADSPSANPHHVILLRRGKIIAECSYAPYVNGMWHITHSMCKSLTGMAVGLAVDDGKLSLDEKLVDIFPMPRNPLRKYQLKDVTVENLLNMTSGVEFRESGAISGNDWIDGFMGSHCKEEPGTAFNYNSMNSYMLSAIIQQRYGITMEELLKERIFEPLGIREVFWELSPEGITKGGWGLFIKPEDAVKLGYLYMQGGFWKGQRILSEEWVKTSTVSHVDNGQYGYGYQLRIDDRPGSFAFNGLFGQNVICMPDIDMILMINAGNRELFATGDLTNIRRRFWGGDYMPSDTPLPENEQAQQALAEEIKYYETVPVMMREPKKNEWGFSRIHYSPITPDEFFRVVGGSTFVMDKGYIGIFPLICQVMHNNFSDGIREISFSQIGSDRYLILTEGRQVMRLKLGFDHAEISDILLHGEPYTVGVTARITLDELGRITLLAEAAFLEEACSRQLYIFFDGDRIELKADETPGDDVIAAALQFTGDEPGIAKIPFIGSIVAGPGMDIMDSTLQARVHSVDYGHRKGTETGTAR